jgi:hypothetical protein
MVSMKAISPTRLKNTAFIADLVASRRVVQKPMSR